MTETHLAPDAIGEVSPPSAPGHGVAMSLSGMARYLVEVEISVKGKTLYRTPKLA